MARTQGKGWFRTRQQTKGEFVYFAATPRTPQPGDGRRSFTSLASSRSFPTRPADGRKLASSGSPRSLKNPFLH